MDTFPKLPAYPFTEGLMYFLEGADVGVSNQGSAEVRCQCHAAAVFCSGGGGRGGRAAPARPGESLR